MASGEAGGLRILVLVQGLYGERIARNIIETGPKGWAITVHRLPKSLPLVIDEPGEFLPSEFPPSDLIVSLGETHQAGQLISAVAKKTGTKAVICPIDSNAWVPPGLKTQVQRELKALGAASAFPKPFCSITETGGKETGDEYIDEFARHFGRPKLKVKCGRTVEGIEVMRSAPCGATFFMAKSCGGVRVEEAREKCALISHHYPCLASMEMDPEFNDTLMHRSAHIVYGEIERAIVECLGKNPWAGSQLTPEEKSA
jgi:hypothetical protein